jgi:hypothetical protein
MELDIEIDDETAPDYEISDNFIENLVDAIRSDMVGNEEQFVLFNLVYATGLFRNPSYYTAAVASGSSSSGKSELKGNVDARWPKHWLLQITDTSDKGLIDDDRWNARYIFAGDEQNKLPSNAIEILKSSHGDDADEDGMGYTYVRSTSADDSDDDKDEIKKQTLPFVVLIADENSAKGSDWELSTRMMDVKVEEDGKINHAVGATMFDHREVSVDTKNHEYNFKFDDGKAAIDNHIANIPRPVESFTSEDPKAYARPVAMPNGDDIGNWDVFEVIESIFDWEKSESKRAASTVASLIRASALLNYHNRDIVTIDGEEHYLAEPQDVANVLACRKTLLGLTHNLDEKKLAIIEALTDEEYGVGGPGPYGGLAAPKKDIHEYIENHASITSITDHYLSKTLDEMADWFIITEHENEGENGAHLYEYHGGSTFGHPNLGAFPEDADPWDPIRDQPLELTVRNLMDELHTRTAEDLMDTDPSSVMGDAEDTAGADSGSQSGQATLGGDTAEGSSDWSEVDVRVAEALKETLDDKRIDQSDAELKVQHMVGVSPVEYYTNDGGFTFVKPEREKSSGDLVGSFMDPDDGLWGEKGPNQVVSMVENSIAKLRKRGKFDVVDDSDTTEDGVVYVMVDVPSVE